MADVCTETSKPKIMSGELHTSRQVLIGKDTINGSLEYFVHGSLDEKKIRDHILGVIPSTFPSMTNLVKGDVSIRRVGGNLWYATVQYVPDYAPLYPGVGIIGPPGTAIPAAPGLNTVLGADFSFDITAQTEHVTQSLATISKTGRIDYPKVGVTYVPPDTKGAIGVTLDGNVAGVDRIKPQLEWATSKTFQSITMGYIYSLAKLVGTTNNATFYGAPAGTQLFIGASGNTKDASKCVVTFKFLKQEDRTNIDILPASKLRVPAKKAWEYLWVAYKNVEDVNQVTQQPVAAYVEKIYESADYALMGIG